MQKTQKITLKKGELMICTSNPERAFPNDAMSCIFIDERGHLTAKSELFVQKNQSFIIENQGDLRIMVSEYDRKRGIDRFSIKKV